jgi:murein DD-endopeptidase MepM/ murein hydrolase activator NlpD
LRGMGNLILLDHGGGYYSVYGHLAVVFVETDDELKEGDIIGQVGTEQSLYQTNLHFEIWKEQNHFDPVTWLR